MINVRRTLHFSIAAYLFLLAGCSTQDAASKAMAELLLLEVAATEMLPISSFNERLVVAQAQGEPWTEAPSQIVTAFFQPPVARNSVLTLQAVEGHLDQLRAVLVVDGMSDDSVRGWRYEARLVPAQNNGWTIAEAQASWRCWRNGNNRFDIALCP